MPVSRVRPAPFAAAFLILLGLLPGPAGAGPTAAEAERIARYTRAYKQLQRHLLFEGAEERESDGERAHPAPDPGAFFVPPGIAPAARGAGPTSGLGAATLAPNVRANNPAGDNPGDTQSEVSVATHGDNVLLAFNDGGPALDSQGYAWSTNGGQSFTDGGAPPSLAGWYWDSDPQVAVNENTGEFWFSALNTTSPRVQNGIGVVKATFSNGTINWGTPHLVRAVDWGDVVLDKEWIAVDPANGRLYVIYTSFGATTPTDTILFQSSSDGGVTWSNPLQLSNPADDGYVQGARVVVGPGGEVYATWNVIGLPYPYWDYFPVRKSTNGGASFTPEIRAANVFSNFSSGAPGFNRGNGITFPTLAVDRSNGPHRGRVYLGWPECVNFYNDPLGTGVVKSEAEPNDTPAQATTFAVGDSVNGALGNLGQSGDDQLDYYKFTATQGQTVEIFSDAVSGFANIRMRLLCADGNTQLAHAAPGRGQPNLIVFTIPATGTYYLLMETLNAATVYQISTGFHVAQPNDRARDHRDVFVASSDDGVVWRAPVRVNNDLPWLDDWLPELTVGNLSKVYAAWYDWRDAPSALCNAQSQIYLASSDDGGASWLTLGALSDAPSDWTDWTRSKSNLAPNQGDYLGLFADCQALYGAWSDVRDPDVNVYTARYPRLTQPSLVSLASATAQPHQVTLAWQASGAAPLTGMVQRSDPGGTTWVDLGTCSTDLSGRMVFADTTVTPGASYDYRLAIPPPPASTWITCEVRVDVPIGVNQLVLGAVRPNPAQTDLIVTFALPTSSPATLKLFDITGREVFSLDVGSLGPGKVTLNLGTYATFRSGVYFVRLAQGGQEAKARVSVVR